MKTQLLISGILLGAASCLHGESNVWGERATADLLRGRSSNAAVWTGREMLVFGGEGMGVSFEDGARYNLEQDSWAMLPARRAPSSRTGHTGVWTGKEMIIWGGFGGRWGNNTNHNDGARYNPASNTWRPVALWNAPAARFDHSAVWTGAEMLVWGGFTDAHSRYAGGHANAHLNSGGRYNPRTDSWKPITRQGAPAKRCWHTAVWTGKEMIIWGGGDATRGFNDGGRYNPVTDTWKPISDDCPLSPRASHVAVWTGQTDGNGCYGGEMIVWGGSSREDGPQAVYFRDGARYNPETDSWKPLSTEGAPTGRVIAKAIWTGSDMLVWGGVNDAQSEGTGDRSRYVGTGARYNPGTDTWTPLAEDGAPSARLTSGVWTGSGLLTFGGYNGRHLNDTYLYLP